MARIKRIVWFIGIWAASVLTIFLTAQLIRLLVQT